MYPKFLIFKLSNVFNKDALSIRKRPLCSTSNKRNKELQHLSKELSLAENFLSTQFSTIDFFILTKFITSYNKKSLQNSLFTQQKKLSSLTRDCSLPIFTANETITNSRNMNYPRKNLIYLKQFYTFESNQKKLENLISSLPLKRFIVRFLITLNPMKPKVKQKRISRILIILIFTTANRIHVYYVNLASYETLEKIKISL